MDIDKKLLEVKDLTVNIGGRRVINNVSFDLNPGRITSLVGESASGKTLTALSVLDLLPKVAVREKGEIRFNGRNIFDLKPEQLRKVRGKDIAMVFQEPFTALNPVMCAGKQIEEALIVHKICAPDRAEKRVKELLSMVRLDKNVMSRYPHELSGGMQQRVVLAMALACGPDVLILDEPTTALDVSVQKQILDLIKQIQLEKRFGILFITHDFSVVNMVADEVCVMKDGIIVERGAKGRVLGNPLHPYTRHLIKCIPKLGDKRERLPA